MKLEAGKTYLNRKGERVKIYARPHELPTMANGLMYGSHEGFPFWDGINTYASCGKVGPYESDYDLIAEAPEENASTYEGIKSAAEQGISPMWESPAKRKIVQVHQIALPPCVHIVARCDDGTMWTFQTHIGQVDWTQLPEIPQP